MMGGAALCRHGATGAREETLAATHRLISVVRLFMLLAMRGRCGGAFVWQAGTFAWASFRLGEGGQVTAPCSSGNASSVWKTTIGYGEMAVEPGSW